MKVGLVGAGNIAAVHVMAVKAYKGAGIVGIADRFGDYARTFAKEHGIPAAFESVAEMIEKAKPDVVHVLTPPATHRAVAVECLNLGCHTLVEKPLAVTPQEAQELIDAAERNKVTLTVGHNYRFDTTIAKARKLIDAGEIGEPVTVEVDYSFNVNRYPAMTQEGAEKSHWIFKLNGGPLEDQMPHPLSMAIGYLGEVREVKTISQNRGKVPKPWDDEIRVSLNGEKAHAEIYISFSNRPDAMIFTVRGTQGTVVADVYGMITTIDRDSILPRAAARGMTGFRRGWQNMSGALANVAGVLTGGMDKTNGVRDLVAGFYDAIQQQTPPPVTMHEGKQVIDLMHRIWPEPVGPRQETPAPRKSRSASQPTVLVTGASGFVGSHLVKRLVEDGETVRAFVRPSSHGLGYMQSLDCELAQGDLSNPEHVRRAMEGIETIYHIGGAMGGGWDVHRASTVQGTQNVLDAAKETKPRRIVYYSSLVVYQVLGYREGKEIDENHPHVKHPEHFGPYTMGKVEAERRVAAAQSEGVPTTVIRPGMVIGARGRVFFPHMGFALRDKLFIIPGSGNVVLPLVYIDNLVEGTIQAARSEAALGRVYNLVDDGRVTVLHYINRFIEQTQLQSRYVRVPFLLPYCAAGCYEMLAALGLLKKGVTSRRQMKWKHKSVIFPNDRAKRDFGWKVTVPLDEALSRTFDWYARTLK